MIVTNIFAILLSAVKQISHIREPTKTDQGRRLRDT